VEALRLKNSSGASRIGNGINCSQIGVLAGSIYDQTTRIVDCRKIREWDPGVSIPESSPWSTATVDSGGEYLSLNYGDQELYR
jgi:hypothetical protein